MDWINYTLFTLGTDRPVLLIDLITSPSTTPHTVFLSEKKE